jgi:hypothetical protein
MQPICLQGLQRTTERKKFTYPTIGHSNYLLHKNIINSLVDDICQISATQLVIQRDKKILLTNFRNKILLFRHLKKVV